jgi:hypothetical protein
MMKSPSGHIVPSLAVLYVLPIKVEGTMAHLNFYIFDVWDFDLLIGQPSEDLFMKDKPGN